MQSLKLEARNLHYSYPAVAGLDKAFALSEISLVLEPGVITGLIGATGSGKTTLIQHLNGLLEPSAGAIYLKGESVRPKTDASRALRHHVGVVFQFPEQQFFEETVFDEVAFGPRRQGLPGDEVVERTRESLELMGLEPDAVGRRSPFRLSGGEMRRVAIASIIALRPQFLILDEPTAGLDAGARHEIFALLRGLSEQGVGILVSSHALEELALLCDSVVVLRRGRVFMEGSSQDIFTDEAGLAQACLSPPSFFALARKLADAGIVAESDALSFVKNVKHGKPDAITILADRIIEVIKG